ncbi:hypothetical protein ABFP60_10995 [Clostridioides difficile]
MTRIIDKNELRIVMAYELGHAILHGNDSAFFLHDHTFYARGKEDCIKIDKIFTEIEKEEI